MLSKTIARALVMGALLIGAATTASAQGECKQIVLPDGTVLTCTAVNGQKVYADANGNVFPFTSQGVGKFKVINTGTNPCQAVLDPLDINITSKNDDLGIVTTRLDATRTSSSSKITSVRPGVAFPAQERISFYAEAEVSSRPGVIFRSIQEVVLVNENVQTFNPHVGETFILDAPVEFEDVENPGVVEYTLKELSITLNPG